MFTASKKERVIENKTDLCVVFLHAMGSMGSKRIFDHVGHLIRAQSMHAEVDTSATPVA